LSIFCFVRVSVYSPRAPHIMQDLLSECHSIRRHCGKWVNADIASHLIYVTNSLVIKSLLHSAPPTCIFFGGSERASVPFNERRALLSRCLISEIRRNHLRKGTVSLVGVIVILMALPAANLNLNAPRPKNCQHNANLAEAMNVLITAEWRDIIVFVSKLCC
jgi:hypothetical protein